METTAQNLQTLLDIALQMYGSAEAVFALAAANGISITDDLETGVRLQVPATSPAMQRRVVEYYAVNNICPATAIDDNETIIPEGIEFWAIEYDFTVS